MSLAMKARQKAKRKGAAKDRVFGCDLVEHLLLSGQDVPQVLKSCTEFVEQHGIVDGIYRLSGVSSNIQKLRLEFDTDRSPDLNKSLYLQDIHCVSSLCKAYFRELPNPLLTYQLYDKFADAVAIQMEEGRLVKIKEVLKELPSPHYRTLEFLMRHLVRMASHSSDTNMHARNLAIVWAPNLLRSKDIEVCGFNGTAAFMEVRIQSIVVEFILTHVEQLFADAPLCDDKYCFSYHVPAVLNQGDGPPQMRPYHTIIELTDSKRKGSLKAKRWRSIFNLGRSSQDAKRKSNKLDDKDDKPSKMRLRPAKSMDSLSSVPCTPDDHAQLGRKKSHKQLTLCRESFDGPASLDSSFLESDEYPEKTKAEERQGESEGEGTAKSEPTTPKASRSNFVGAAPAGRSPKAARSRAEKCAGVHISGPFSVTVPFHITSNLTLSRLTRGLECPALSHCTLDQETLESSAATEEEPARQAQPRLTPTATTEEEDPTEADTSVGCLLDSEEHQMSMEVQDSFSFLDSQDAWLGDSLDGDQPWKNSHVALECAGGGAGGCSSLEDDVGNGFMNEIIADSMQLEMFPAVPPLDYLSIEECMNEHSEDEDGQYYLAAGFLDSDELSKEADSEDVYLSAFDDLTPLATELQHLQEFENPNRGANPPENTLAQPFSLAGEISAGDPADVHLETVDGGLPPRDPESAGSSQGPECAKVAEEEEGVSLNSRSHLDEMEPVLKAEAEAAEAEPSLPLLPVEGADAAGGDELHVQAGCLLQDGGLNGTLERFYTRSLAPEHEKWATQPNLEDEQERRVWSAPEMEEEAHSPCSPSAGADGPTQKAVGATDECADFGFPVQEAEQIQKETVAHQPLLLAEASLSLEDLPLLEAELWGSPWVDNGSEDASLKRLPMPASLLAPSPEPPDWPRTAPPDVPLSNHCVELDGLPLTGSSPKSCPENLLQKPEHAPPAKAADASAQDLYDGSVHMTLTSSTIRVQQVKSFPVVPPKPQFAKVPPSLAPRSPTKEAPPTWPNLPVPDENSGNGVKDVPDGGSVQRSPPPTSLDTFGGTTDSDKCVESLPSKMPTSPEKCCGDSGALQKQRNSMTVSLENYSREEDSRGETTAKPRCPSLDKCSLWSQSSDLSGDDLQHVSASWAESAEKSSSDVKGEGGEGEPPQKKLPPMPAWLDKHSSEGSRQKQRWTTWRNGASMSFDEAVALAKERHVAQAPVRRMQTYCYGDAEGLPGPPGTEKPAPQPKPALKPLGQRPLRPLSCIGTAVAPEALSTATGKPALPPASPCDAAPESPQLPGQEALPSPQDLMPRSRLSWPKLGQRLSLSEEVSGAASQERR